MNMIEKRVIYIGKRNDFTFRENIEVNSKGIVKNKIEISGRRMYQVEIDDIDLIFNIYEL